MLTFSSLRSGAGGAVYIRTVPPALERSEKKVCAPRTADNNPIMRVLCWWIVCKTIGENIEIRGVSLGDRIKMRIIE